jgi:diacylglycerol O-acyltransferase
MASDRSKALRFDDRMSDADRLMWNLEADPILRSTILSTIVLDSAPDMDRLVAKMAHAAETIPRLKQRVVADPIGIAPPTWERDPYFDLDFHLRRIRVPAPGGERELLDLAAPIAMQAFDKDRPLWELHVVEGLEGGRCAVMMKLHHAISDGVGLVRMTECLIERGPTDEGSDLRVDDREVETDEEPNRWSRTSDALNHRIRTGFERMQSVGSTLLRSTPDMLRDPIGVARELREAVESIARVLKPASEPMSPIMTGRSNSVHFDALQIPLAELKSAGKRAGGTVNDAFLAGVISGFARYHNEQGAPVDELRTLMPINVRSEEKSHVAGNQFAPARFTVPTNIQDPAERIRAIGKICRVQRDEPAMPWIGEISGVLGNLPTFAVEALVGAMQKTTDFTTSNVPGPRRPIWMSGAQVEKFMPFGPLAGASANLTVFSYNGVMQVGVNVDPAAVTDSSLLLESLQKGFDEILTLGE